MSRARSSFPRPAAVLVAALLLTAAGCRADRPCTDMAAPSGVALDVRPPLAATVSRASLRVCAPACRTVAVPLGPATTARPDGCRDPRPDGACSATAVRTGGKYGFAPVTALPETAVRVTVVLRDRHGTRVLDRTLTVTPKAVYPNGPHCGRGGNQTGIIAAASGLRERP